MSLQFTAQKTLHYWHHLFTDEMCKNVRIESISLETQHDIPTFLIGITNNYWKHYIFIITHFLGLFIFEKKNDHICINVTYASKCMYLIRYPVNTLQQYCIYTHSSISSIKNDHLSEYPFTKKPQFQHGLCR